MTNDSSPVSGFQRNFPTFHRLLHWLTTPLRSRRVWKALGFAGMGLGTLIALFYAIENWRGARAWKHVRDELRAKGEPLSYAELVPPLPPAADNFATTPLFEGLFDKSIDPKSKQEVWRLKLQEHPLPYWLFELKDRGMWWPGGPSAIEWRQSIHRVPLTKEQIKGGGNSFVRDSSAPGQVIDGVDLVANPPIEAVRLLLEKSRPVMDEIETAVRRPSSQFPIHYEDHAGAILIHLSRLNSLGRLFGRRAQVRLETNDASGAIEDVATTLRLAESLKGEPILISGLVRIMIMNEALWPMWQGLTDARWTEAQVRQMQDQLAQIDVLAGYQRCLVGERIMGTDFIDALERERAWGWWMNRQENFFGVNPLWFIPAGWFDQNKVAYVRLNNSYAMPAIDAVGRRFHREKALAHADRNDADVGKKWNLFAFGGMDRSFHKEAALKFAIAQTQIDLATIACGLERYKLKEGRYPEALGSLVPAYLAALPHDLIDGKPLRYRTADNGFVLYSIGYNQTDEGGEVITKTGTGIRAWIPEEGDWVWSHSEATNH